MFVQAPNMFTTDAEILVNTVNCVGIMGAGLALAFKQKFPDMYQEYRLRCQNGLLTPGCLDTHFLPDGLVVVNFATKNDWRNPSTYQWIDMGLEQLAERFERSKLTKMAMPLPGCGLGGLDKYKVLAKIEKVFKSLPETKTIYIPELP